MSKQKRRFRWFLIVFLILIQSATYSQDQPQPGRNDFDSDGRYHSIQTDKWGTTWEYRIYGIWGHPISWPLNDLSRLDDYHPPQPPVCQGEAFDAAKAAADRHKQQYYLLAEGGSLFEKLHSLRRFEDVLMDITLDTPEINRMADMIVENLQGYVCYALAIDCDRILFGDDFGTQTGLLVSPVVWRRFFKPRYQSLFAPLVQAGKKYSFIHVGRPWSFWKISKRLALVPFGLNCRFTI